MDDYGNDLWDVPAANTDAAFYAAYDFVSNGIWADSAYFDIESWMWNDNAAIGRY